MAAAKSSKRLHEIVVAKSMLSMMGFMQSAVEDFLHAKLPVLHPQFSDHSFW